MSWAVNAVGALFGAEQSAAIGRQRKAAAYEEARQTEESGEQEVATASFNMERIARRAGEIIARNRAVAAKGGQSSTDPTVLAVQAEVKSRSTVDQMLELVSAQERRRQLRDQARQLRYRGDMDEHSGKLGQLMGYAQAGATVLEGPLKGRFGG